MAKKVTTTIYITEDQQSVLKELNQRTKIPVAEFVRQGIDLVFEKYSDFIPGQLELNGLPFGQLTKEVSSTDKVKETVK